MYTKSFPFEIKADGEKRIFEGYASTWSVDLIKDQIHQGAFRKSIAERFPKNQIKILWQHSDPIGLPTHMEEDSKGLYVVGKLSKTALANDALELMRDGVIDSMSIGYDVVKDSFSEDKSIRNLHEVKLYEFSPVTFACQPEAMLTGVKRAMMGNDYDIDELTRLIKAGRMFSAQNLDKLRSMMSELQTLITSAEPPIVTQEQDENFLATEPIKGIHIMTDLLAEMKNYKLK